MRVTHSHHGIGPTGRAEGDHMRFLSGRSKLAKALVTVTAVAVTATAGIFVGVGVADAAQFQSNNQVNSVSFATKTDTAPFQTSSASWVTLTSLSVSSAFNMNTVIVRFSANTKCNGTGDGQYCSVRIINASNGAEMEPAAGTGFSWQYQGGN